jgi:hypothetical protein
MTDSSNLDSSDKLYALFSFLAGNREISAYCDYFDVSHFEEGTAFSFSFVRSIFETKINKEEMLLAKAMANVLQFTLWCRLNCRETDDPKSRQLFADEMRIIDPDLWTSLGYGKPHIPTPYFADPNDIYFEHKRRQIEQDECFAEVRDRIDQYNEDVEIRDPLSKSKKKFFQNQNYGSSQEMMLSKSDRNSAHISSGDELTVEQTSRMLELLWFFFGADDIALSQYFDGFEYIPGATYDFARINTLILSGLSKEGLLLSDDYMLPMQFDLWLRHNVGISRAEAIEKFNSERNSFDSSLQLYREVIPESGKNG